MKLRIKGDSLRLRLGPSEVQRLLAEGRVEDTVHFGAAPEARLTYALERSAASADSLSVRHTPLEVAVLIPANWLQHWSVSSEIGIYGSVPVSSGQLEITIEKDFACLDRAEPENQDTYPNPKQGTFC